MPIFEVLQMGQFHSNYCEDFLISCEVGANRHLIAVMDGCSMGVESHFAATLTGKLLRKIAKEWYYKEFVSKTQMDLPQLLQEISKSLFEQLKALKTQLALDREELLSTLMLGILDVDTHAAEILVVGDGLVCCDGALTEFEQDNKPDYLGYHLEKGFEDWYPAQHQRLSFNNIEDLSIATDGIFTFKKYDNKIWPEKHDADLIHFLLNDGNGSEQENMLKKKMIFIEEEWGLKPTDDLAIIRVMIPPPSHTSPAPNQT